MRKKLQKCLYKLALPTIFPLDNLIFNMFGVFYPRAGTTVGSLGRHTSLTIRIPLLFPTTLCGRRTSPSTTGNTTCRFTKKMIIVCSMNYIYHISKFTGVIFNSQLTLDRLKQGSNYLKRGIYVLLNIAAKCF